MGYTGFTKNIIETVINTYHPKDVMDLGSQQDYDQPNLPAPYISGWYADKGIFYESIDLNGENNSHPFDLGIAMDLKLDPAFAHMDRPFDFLVDAGTSEHVSRDGAFSWEAIYNCWLNKHNLLKIGGVMVNENPKTGNWPGHGFNYYTKEFYRQLEVATDYHIILLDEHPAMQNRIDGWNVVCVMIKMSNRLPSMEEFMQFGLQQS